MIAEIDVQTLKDILSSIEGLRQSVGILNVGLQNHMNLPFTRAHPRDGSTEKVLQYLGLDVEKLEMDPNQRDVVTVRTPAKDNSQEQTADKVL